MLQFAPRGIYSETAIKNKTVNHSKIRRYHLQYLQLEKRSLVNVMSNIPGHGCPSLTYFYNFAHHVCHQWYTHASISLIFVLVPLSQMFLP